MEISDFVKAKERLLDYFGIKDDYFIKTCEGKSWEVTDEGDLHLLRFGSPGTIKQSCVIVKRNNVPIIVKKDKYTLVMALDCVKVCFIFENSLFKGNL